MGLTSERLFDFRGLQTLKLPRPHCLIGTTFSTKDSAKGRSLLKSCLLGRVKVKTTWVRIKQLRQKRGAEKCEAIQRRQTEDLTSSEERLHFHHVWRISGFQDASSSFSFQGRECVWPKLNKKPHCDAERSVRDLKRRLSLSFFFYITHCLWVHQGRGDRLTFSIGHLLSLSQTSAPPQHWSSFFMQRLASNNKDQEALMTHWLIKATLK